MNPRRLVIILIALALTGCQPTAQPASFATTTPSSSPTPTPASTVTTGLEIPVVPDAVVTKTPVAPTLPAASPTPPPISGTGWLAFLEGGRLTIRDLPGQNAVQVTSPCSQILGWSPRGRYLLALRPDGANIVVDPAGKILSVLENLPQPAFWAQLNEPTSPDEWLVVPQPDASLEMRSFPSGATKPLFDPGSLGADGTALVRWGSDGAVILTPSLAQLQAKVSFANGFFSSLLANGPDSQNLATGAGGIPVSADFHTRYFQVLDGVPGSQSAVMLGFINVAACVSCQVDGLELVSLDTWSGRTLPLGVTLLNTPEAYAWNPAQPGLLALAAGGSRFTLENKRLMLLDVPAGTSRTLTGKDQVTYEPAWSPDGRWLAYTALPAREGASGSGQEIETLLGGRAIAMIDPSTGASRMLTHPADNEIDGWPRLSAGAQTLLYARKSLADATTQVRQLDLTSGEDRLVVSVDMSPRACHRIACGWDQMLAYAPGAPASPPAPVLDPTPTPAVQSDSPRPGMTTYHNAAYGFSFEYPSTWALVDTNQPNLLRLVATDGALVIGYRRAAQQARIQRTGVGSGDFVPAGSIQFLGKSLKRDLLVYGKLVKEVFYHGDSEFSAGNLVFTLGLDNNGAKTYEDADISAATQKEVDQILVSFRLDQP